MKKNNSLYVVGVGASAGGLEAIQSMVEHLPENLENIAIIIAQHLSPDYKSMLVELLSRKTNLIIEHIEADSKIQPNKIYICPPSDDVELINYRFSLRKPEGIGAHPSINTLLNSLANHESIVPVGIILSGTGRDGSLGVSAIKQSGGIVFAQKPQLAKYDGMPTASIETGCVDYILSAKELGQELIPTLYKRSIPTNQPVLQNEASTTQKILSILEHDTGVNFSDYKISSLSRRLDKRISDLHLNGEEEYLRFLMNHKDEPRKLFENILIGVTNFFRDPEVFKNIESIISEIVQRKRDGEIIRVWIAGCATGEEAYTHALLLEESIRKTDKNITYQVFATDIDTRALTVARTGNYNAATVKHVPKKLLDKYFVKLDKNTYQVDKAIRDQVLFSQHDVTANPPFLRIDILSCRNLLIYFNTNLQKQVMPLFYYALNKDGFLILGKSENINDFQHLFATVDGKYKFFQRKEVDNAVIKFPYVKYTKPQKKLSTEETTANKSMSIGDMVKETFYATFDKPYVVVNEQFDITEISGDISPYLQLKQGVANLNVLKLIISDLQIELRALSSKAISSMKPVSGRTRKIALENEVAFVRIVIKPLVYSKPNSPLFVVIFDRIPIEGKFYDAMSSNQSDEKEGPLLRDLQQELDSTKEHMNSLVEELETSNEELQAMNEEIQASNEELQASNEELETSNEELQATNEELDNAYAELNDAADELKAQTEELAISNRSFDTILNTSLVGYIMIDKDYRVIVFNKTAAKTFKKLFNSKLEQGQLYVNAVPEDVFSRFQKSLRSAFKGKRISKEKLFHLKDEEVWLDVTYVPVKKKGALAEAVVFSFVNISERKRSELRLQAANDELAQEKSFLSIITSSMKSHLWTTNESGEFTYANKVFLDYVGHSLKGLQKLEKASMLHPNEETEIMNIWTDALKNKTSFSVEHRLQNKAGDYHWFLTHARPTKRESDNLPAWIGISTNIDAIKEQARLEGNIQDLQKMKDNLININKVKDEFISLASHQLRTPATAVKQYVRMVIDGYAGQINEKQADFLHTAYKSNERQLSIINDLLKTAQLDSEEYLVNRSDIDLKDLIESITEALDPALKIKNQRISITTKGKTTISGDKADLELVFTNLVENASKYSYDGGHISVSINKKKDDVCVVIADEGVGLDESNYRKIFEKFSRVDNDLSDTVTGTGLGLYITKKIIDAHNGSVYVRPNKPQGTKFSVELPL